MKRNPIELSRPDIFSSKGQNCIKPPPKFDKPKLEISLPFSTTVLRSTACKTSVSSYLPLEGSASTFNSTTSVKPVMARFICSAESFIVGPSDDEAWHPYQFYGRE